MAKVCFVGEQATVMVYEMKGVDFFGVSRYSRVGRQLHKSLQDAGHEVTRYDTAMVPEEFPERLEDIKHFDAILISDVGACSFLFHPEMLSKCIRHPNRLVMLRDYVHQGGGLAMIGGWMSFAGMGGKAKYHDTPLEEALPVTCLPYDDRMERPEGVTPQRVAPDHPILKGLPKEWPFFLGYNRVMPKEGSQTILSFGRDPLLTVGAYGKGRVAAFTSDCAPHWGPHEFMQWEGYGRFWSNLVEWLSGR
jgi:uncharacterized membrane protein